MFPCGFMRLCGAVMPQVAYINERMLELLRYDAASEEVELLKRDAYLMLPPEERRKLARLLSRASEEGAPLSGEIAFLRRDGLRAVMLCTVSAGAGEEFFVACADITDISRTRRAEDARRYLDALVEAYDDVLEHDFAAGSLKWVHGNERLRAVPMNPSEGVELWLREAVFDEDRGRVREFLARRFLDCSAVDGGAERISFRPLSPGEAARVGIVLRRDGAAMLCVRAERDAREAETMEDISVADAGGAEAETRAVYIRTFGYFDVFVDDKPIAFRSQKSKELFALLVDRRGGYVSSEEAISFLWENEPISPVTLARYRKVALRLKNILAEYGIADAVEAVDGKRRIVTDRVRCDLYDYLSGREEFAGLFKGSYLTNYSWGEVTLGELTARAT